MRHDHTIAVVIPCYRVEKFIAKVIEGLPEFVDQIIIVDDGCPQGSLEAALSTKDERLCPVVHSRNQGVGSAMKTGYLKALELRADIIIKIDGDGQMSGIDIGQFIDPLIRESCEYTKGNRFHDLVALASMPKIRLFGNSLLSFVAKLVSGYWRVMDPTNGMTAIRAETLMEINLEAISDRFFFETDMLVQLYLHRTHVEDIPIPAQYHDEQSNLRIRDILMEFPPKIVHRLAKRIFFRYYLYDFNMASVYLLFAIPMLFFSISFGLYHWIEGFITQTEKTAGTVMLSALPFILGIQFLLQAIQIDIENTP